MSRFLAVACSCEISRDPDENTRRHQALVDELNALVTADGWAGVKLTRLETHLGRTQVEIEPGVSALTLEYLRSFREAAQPKQGALL